METKEQKAAMKLACEWERRAKMKFADAEHEKDPMGRRLIEYGAVCYFNAATEIREAFGLAPNGKGEPGRTGKSGADGA